MSERARQFLQRWTSEHIEAVPDTHRLRAAVWLVTKCRADAVTARVPAEELRAAADDDMIRYMLAAFAVASTPSDADASQRPTMLERLLTPISAMRRRAA